VPGGWKSKQGGLWVALAIFIGAIIVAVITVIVAGASHPNPLAAGLLQGIAVVLSVAASFWFGRLATEQAAADSLRPHAKSAFRRVVGLFRAFGNISDTIDFQMVTLEQIASENHGHLEVAHVRLVMDALKAQAVAQISTVNDAMDDWRDLVPEDVQAIEEQARTRDHNI